MRLKKVLFFFPNFARGGIEKTSILLIEYFLSKGIIVNLITYNSKNKKIFKNLKIIYSKKKSENFIIKNLFCIYKLYKLLKDSDKKNTVIFSVQNNILSIMIAKMLGFRIVVRNSAPIDYFMHKKKFFDELKLFIKMIIYSFSDLIIANSRGSASKIQKKLIFRTKTISIPNPIKITKNKIPKNKKNILLYVGRLSFEKGVFRLIAGFELFFKKNKNFVLKIVGDGDQRKEFENYIKLKKLKNSILLINWKNNLKKFYKEAKILLLPSFFEGFGHVLIEGLSFGVPCISNKTDGPKDILGNGKYGLIIKDNSPITICKGIEKILENYNAFKKKAQKGHNINIKYNSKYIGQKYLENLNSVL